MSKLEYAFDAHDVIVNLNRKTSNRDPAFREPMALWRWIAGRSVLS
jgi:hypothetical protein